MPPIKFEKAEWCYINSTALVGPDNYDASMSSEILIIIDDFENQMKTAKTLTSREFTMKLKDTLWNVSVIPESEDEKGHLGAQ